MINHTVKKEKALKSNKVRFSDTGKCHKRTITMNLKTLKLTYEVKIYSTFITFTLA